MSMSMSMSMSMYDPSGNEEQYSEYEEEEQ